ncbi:hypothetical protein HMPREF3047_07015 [Neisseria sp. HMSC075C10]|uniref:hypothetical protein n=1 Tax=Neisseria sp. HMSC075C10 TaxID=1739539 RepID=UPI0008A22DD5|nr:hypothetical protein [Neisseria sp. HMSC075C10]OFO38455.1 hypothetical protein HMPREF3047_07015 [Neisseria sp. HMSC075C10]
MTQSNLDQATLIIARATAAAQKDAAAAKKLAESPAVSATIDTEGRLTLNGTASDIHLITPAKVSEAVGNAFADVKTPSLIITEQAKFEGEQIEAAAKIAIEKGKFHIEDALTPELRKKVYDGWYKNNPSKEDALNIVRLIQAWYDRLPSNVFISSRGGFFPVTKNTGYKPEYYGADRRQISVGGMMLTVNGQQPCITFHHSVFNVYDFSLAEFCVEEMGQDVFHLCGKSEGNTILHGGKITTRAYKDYGYTSGMADPDKRWIPHIDGWTREKPHIGTGMALKGTAEAGFNTTTLSHDVARYMNNSADTSGVQQPEGYTREKIRQLHIDESSQRYRSVGGYWNSDGLSQFPQDDGTVAPTFGLWRGGQVWSRGYGWRLFDCRGTEIRYFDVRGFTGGAVIAGLHGSPSGEDVGAGEVAKAYEKGMVAVNTRITGGYFTHNYTCGVEAVRASGYELCGIFAPDSVVGHPDAHLEHVRGWNNSTVSLDPGYQQCTSRYLPMDNLFIHDNVFGFGKRKVMDIHTGNNVKIVNNSGRAMYYGISTVIEEVFAATDGRASKIADPYSFYYQDSNIEITGNTIVSGNIGIHPINGALGVLSRRNQKKWWLRCRQLINDNTVYAPRGLQCNYGHNHFLIERNQFTFALPFGDFYGMRYVSGFAVTNGGSGYTTAPKVIITGGGAEAFGAEGEAVVKDGKVTEIKLRRIGSRYDTPPTVTLEGGGGTGATATATVNTSTYGMSVGAEARYGTMLAAQIRGNYIQNSPDGNFMRQMIIGKLRGASIVGNHCDITPYKNAEQGKTEVGQPYTVDTVKYRNGLLSAGFYPIGELDNCTVAENYMHNQLTDTVEVWTGARNHKNTQTTDYAATLLQAKLSDLEAEITKLKASTVGKASETVTQPTPETAVPKADSATPKAEPEQPTSTANEQPAPAATETSIKFTFNGLKSSATEAIGSNSEARLTSVINALRAGEPEGWTGAFGEEGNIRYMKAQAGENGRGHRYIESSGVSAATGTPTTVIMPFKLEKGGTPGAAFILLPMTGESSAVGGVTATHGENGFTLRMPENATVDGKVNRAGNTYSYGEWHIAVVPWNTAFDKIRIGTSHVANTGRTVRIGAGFEIVQGDVSKAADKGAALMTGIYRKDGQ